MLLFKSEAESEITAAWKSGRQQTLDGCDPISVIGHANEPSYPSKTVSPIRRTAPWAINN